MTSPHPDPSVADRPVGPGCGEAPLETPLASPRDPAATTAPPEVLGGRTTPRASITVRDGVLVLRGDIDTQLCREFQRSGPALLEIVAVDARAVTFLGSPGLALLAGVARLDGTALPLWASSRVVLRPLRVTGLDRLFDLHDAPA